MELIVVWNWDKINKFEKELIEVRNTYKLWDTLKIKRLSLEDYNKDNNEKKETNLLILHEPEIDFTDILIEDKIYIKDEIKELIEQLFWIQSSWCSTTGCSTCSSWC